MDSSLPIAGSGITRCFQSFNTDVEIEQDKYGFVIIPSLGLFGISEVLDASAILMRGRPWMGKTYLANAIENQQSQLSLGKYIWHLALEDHTQGHSLEPNTWKEWCA